MRADDLLDSGFVQPHIAQVRIGLKGCQQLDQRTAIIRQQELADMPLPAGGFGPGR